MTLIDKYYFNKYNIDYIKWGLFMWHIYCLTSIYTSCTLLDPMTDEEDQP